MKPITITLNQIKAHEPCAEGWETILAATHLHGGDYDKPFPLSAALETNGLNDVLWALRCLPEHDRLWRKYAVWCARQVQHLMNDQRSLAALDVADRHADGLATDDKLAAAWDAACHAARDAARTARGAALTAAQAAAQAAALAARDAVRAARAAQDAARDAQDAAQDAARDAAQAAALAAALAARDAARGAQDAAWYEAQWAQVNKLKQVLDAGEWV